MAATSLVASPNVVTIATAAVYPERNGQEGKEEGGKEGRKQRKEGRKGGKTSLLLATAVARVWMVRRAQCTSTAFVC